MRLSVTSWSFPACSLGEAWAIAAALGIGHIDVGLLHGPSLDRSEVVGEPEAAAKRLRDTGVAVANLYWLFGPSPHDNPLSDRAVASRNLQEFDAALVFAEAIGATTLFVLPGVTMPGFGREELVRASTDTLRQMVDRARAHGIQLTVEPHVGGLLDSPARTLAFLEEVPGLKLTLDYAHFVCLGYRQEEIDPLAEYAAHMHMRQARPGALQAKWGEGTIDFGAMVERLAAVGYDGFLSIEYVHQDYMSTLFDDVLTETVRMRDHLRAYGVD